MISGANKKMYVDPQGGSAASAELLPTGINPEAFDLDPQETGGLLVPEENPVTHIHGSVKVPGIDKPVDYEGSMPDHLLSKFVSLNIPGFGGIKGSYSSYADALAAKQGIFTVKFVPARSSSKRTDPQKIHEDTIPAIIQDLPNNKELADAPNGTTLDFSKLFVDMHSMGGISGTRYALKNHKDIAGLIYKNSVGLGKCDIPAQYLVNLVPCALFEMLPAFANGDFRAFRNLKTALRMSKHLLGNVGHTIGEVTTCHTANLIDGIEKLGGLGVKRAIICGAKDNLVPADPSIAAASHLADDFLIVPDLDHFGPQKRPEKTALIVGGLIRKYS